ncbi:YrdB family protein [Amycolatopsis acidiphila]|uniref:YrdB family protein n=1 Tax=Amycolatopsis acidiphila TaxID=715473 RepID=UPI001E324E5B|nr:YrdB family protein [Amycolatopsis acidiphila]UIJ61027.1 YrdB family protein [Amycolatopsis acidiphila]
MNDGLAFLLELLALAALAYWGFTTGDGIALKLVLGIGAPVLAAVVWGLFAAPRATFGLPRVAVVVVKVLWFGAAVTALCVTGHPVLGAALAVLAVANLGYATAKKMATA